MTVADEIFAVLAGLGGGTPTVFGRISDAIGAPIAGATIRALASGPFSGRELARATSDAAGRFRLSGAFAQELVVRVDAPGAEAHVVVTDVPGLRDVGEIRLVPPLRLTGSVGDGGNNRPHDVRRLQDRLHRLGRLSDADVAAEPVDLHQSPPAPLGPRLLAALARHLAACLGRVPPGMRVEPTGLIARLLAEDPPVPLVSLGLAQPVGELPGGPVTGSNARPAFHRVQERLRQLGFLRPADHASERTDPAAAGTVAIAAAPSTLKAIVRFDRTMAGGSLHAIVPGERNAHLLNDPQWFGRRPLPLGDSVGAAGRNLPDDVRRVQDRLRLLGLLSSADRTAERPPSTPPVRIAEAALPQTIAALRALRETRLGEPAPAAGVVDPVDAALRRLDRPARLELSDSVGWGPALAAANRPSDVRRVQDRLRLLGLLSQPDYDAECADPDATERVDQSQMTRTAVALALAREQRGPFTLRDAVGRSAANACSDVRLVQDRLHGLGFLADADHEREQVDPEGGLADDASLAATFQAIEQLRRTLFELPPADTTQSWTAQALVEPGDETHALLADPLFFGRHPLRLSASVGTDGWNFPGDVRAVQDRLRTMRLLSAAEYLGERVDPLRVCRVDHAEIPATCQAIRRFRTSLVGETEPVVPRVELRSPALAALDDRLGALRATLDLTDSVGWGGHNAPADVALVLDRLHGLGLLADDDHELESQAAPATSSGGLVDAQIPQCISAIGDWQQLMLAAAIPPIVAPWFEALRTLAWPALPRRCALALAGSVGRGGRNAADDVRRVQDRLFELGLMDGAVYFTDRADPAASGAIPAADLASTITAIERLQRSWAGLGAAPPTGVITASGHAQRVLEDPAFSTPTAPNPYCALSSAGPARPALPGADVTRIAVAIEAVEGGVSSGEIPSNLRNASGTPASWGSAQVIGAAAVTTLANSASFATFYGLAAAQVAALTTRAASVATLFDQICDAVAVNTSEGKLQAQIAAYVASHDDDVRRDTGLGPDDIARMFRAGQLRRHLIALGTGGNEAVLFSVASHPDAAANLAALGLSVSEAGTYLRNPTYQGEHQAGFATRALLLAVEGQAIRNALTDDTGLKIGRRVILANWNATDGLGLDPRQRAQVTAYMHHNGGLAAAHAANLATIAADAYVGRVMALYDATP